MCLSKEAHAKGKVEGLLSENLCHEVLKVGDDCNLVLLVREMLHTSRTYFTEIRPRYKSPQQDLYSSPATCRQNSPQGSKKMARWHRARTCRATNLNLSTWAEVLIPSGPVEGLWEEIGQVSIVGACCSCEIIISYRVISFQ